jgi:hypothetical protein
MDGLARAFDWRLNRDNLCMGSCHFDLPSLAMTCAPPSFRISGKCPHVTHGPSLLGAHTDPRHVLPRDPGARSTRIFLHPQNTVDDAYSSGVGVAMSDEEGGAGTTRDHVSKVEWTGHRAPETRSHPISDAGCYTSKPRTRSSVLRLCNPGHVLIAFVRF